MYSTICMYNVSVRMYTCMHMFMSYISVCHAYVDVYAVYLHYHTLTNCMYIHTPTQPNTHTSFNAPSLRTEAIENINTHKCFTQVCIYVSTKSMQVCFHITFRTLSSWVCLAQTCQRYYEISSL